MSFTFITLKLDFVVYENYGVYFYLLSCYCSLYKSEEVQYFQFDSSGNMYVFEPGAGMSGIAKIVKPGDDFNATWSTSNSTTVNITSEEGYTSTMTSEVNSSYDCTQFISTGKATKR